MRTCPRGAAVPERGDAGAGPGVAGASRGEVVGEPEGRVGLRRAEISGDVSRTAASGAVRMDAPDMAVADVPAFGVGAQPHLG